MVFKENSDLKVMVQMSLLYNKTEQGETRIDLFAVLVSATSDQTNWRIIKSKARHNIASHAVCPYTRRKHQLSLNYS